MLARSDVLLDGQPRMIQCRTERGFAASVEMQHRIHLTSHRQRKNDLIEAKILTQSSAADQTLEWL